MEPKGRTSSGVARLFDVLVVDDDADTREVLGDLLEDNRCLVRVVGSSREAEHAIRERIPDVVVSDLDLGGADTGWAFAERMRDDPRTEHVGRIAITGTIDPRVEVVRPFDAYLRKPLDTTLLLELVSQLAVMSRSARVQEPARHSS